MERNGSFPDHSNLILGFYLSTSGLLAWGCCPQISPPKGANRLAEFEAEPQVALMTSDSPKTQVENKIIV